MNRMKRMHPHSLFDRHTSVLTVGNVNDSHTFIYFFLQKGKSTEWTCKQEDNLLKCVFFRWLIICQCIFSLPAQCPANEERSSSSGVILSPMFPGNYPNSQTCSWLLRMLPGTLGVVGITCHVSHTHLTSSTFCLWHRSQCLVLI